VQLAHYRSLAPYGLLVLPFEVPSRTVPPIQRASEYSHFSSFFLAFVLFYSPLNFGPSPPIPLPSVAFPPLPFPSFGGHQSLFSRKMAPGKCTMRLVFFRSLLLVSCRYVFCPFPGVTPLPPFVFPPWELDFLPGDRLHRPIFVSSRHDDTLFSLLNWFSGALFGNSVSSCGPVSSFLSQVRLLPSSVELFFCKVTG